GAVRGKLALRRQRGGRAGAGRGQCRGGRGGRGRGGGRRRGRRRERGGGRGGGLRRGQGLGLLDEGVAFLELVVGVGREPAAGCRGGEVHLDRRRQGVALGAEGREVRAEALVLRVVARAARCQRPRVADQHGGGEATDARVELLVAGRER